MSVLRADRSRQDAVVVTSAVEGELRKMAPLEVTLTSKFRSETDEGVRTR
jgi:hypothetical protein